MAIDIIDFKKKYETEALNFFYKSVFYNRKEFEYARLPTWTHRYSLENNNIIRLAVDNNKIIGTLGLILYSGYYQNKKTKLGFFVDNCVLPKYDYNKVMIKLFESIEKEAKKAKIDFILGWDYKTKTDLSMTLFKKMNYSIIDGINWFGSGTNHVDAFYVKDFRLSIIWKFLLKLFSYKQYRNEKKLKPLNNEKIRKMKENDLPQIVNLINSHTKKMEFSPMYTVDSLKNIIKKYRAHGYVVVSNKKIIGVIIYFLAPWSGWMYGKPEYSKSYGFFLIKHPLEFAIKEEFSEKIAPHLLFRAMKDESHKGYFMLVDVFDRRIDWLREAYFNVGADELPYDFGTIILKNLSGKKVELKKPIYIPTNLVISPYISKDY